MDYGERRYHAQAKLPYSLVPPHENRKMRVIEREWKISGKVKHFKAVKWARKV